MVLHMKEDGTGEGAKGAEGGRQERAEPPPSIPGRSGRLTGEG